jgi:Uncharacterized protein predicted to be involved in DNA repair (RAMP superfamily)
MAQQFIKIRGIDPLLFRDGSPFTAEVGGLTARSLPLPFPTTVAAFVRSQIGAAMQWDWRKHSFCQRAHDIEVHGPLLLRDEQYVLPAPKDALLTKDGIPVPLRPLKAEPDFIGGCDTPDGLLPLVQHGRLPSVEAEKKEADTGKPPLGYNFWPKDALLRWLECESLGALPNIPGLPEEERIGIQMDAGVGRAEEGKLYAIRLRAFEETKTLEAGTERHTYSLVARVDLPDGHDYQRAGTLGGERRLTAVEGAENTCNIWPRCPQGLKDKLASATRVRMVLATPAHFRQGWKPDWIEASGSGVAHLPAGIAKVQLKLVAAAMDRRVAVSGWGLREGKPREIRWLVPAGAVYFFEVMGGDPTALWRDAWMKPMSDDEQGRRDGLGLALWGTW